MADKQVNRTVIAGGGIAGLAAAHRLTQLPTADEIVLVEPSRRLGGKILTDRPAGFVIEGGPDSFLSSKPAASELCVALGIVRELQETNEDHRRTYVLHQGELHPMPEGLSGLVPSRIDAVTTSSLLSDEGKLRFAQEPGIPARAEQDDESVAEFLSRRFGGEAFERLIEPLMAGIYAGDAGRMSLAATFPQLQAMERDYGSLVVAAQTPARTQTGQPRAGFLTPMSGMERIVEALTRVLTNVHVLNAAVRRVTERSGGYHVELDNGDALPARGVVLATPAHITANLVEDLDPGLADALSGIPYASTVTISMAYPTSSIPRPLDGTGYIVPRTEGRDVLASTWVSSKFRHRAPPGWALIRMFLGRYGDDDIIAAHDEDVLRIAQAEAADVLGVEAKPSLARIFRWPAAMPQYTLGHLGRLTAMDAALQAHPGLALAGSAYCGVGIPDCITSGRRASESLP